MLSRILEKPLQNRKSFFLLGPRGTGKTHWIKAKLKKAVYIDLLDMDVYSRLLADPHRLVDFIPPKYQDWIVIDEVQKIPALLNEVHRLIEQKQHIFVLTGSSARSLRKKGVNLLAGRALVYHMHPLTVQELGEQFSLDKALAYGMLPALLSEPDPHAYLKAYVHTYLREEVFQEGLTRQLSNFARFLETASFSQGQVLNMSAIAREANVHAKSVAYYFEILEDLLLGYQLPVFNRRAKRQTIQKPKFYFFDVGVYQTLRPRGFIDTSAEIEGPALETLFLQSVKALNDYYFWDYKLYYWQTLSGVEVDFILYGSHGLFAFEIKRTKTASRNDTKGLRAFRQDFPMAKLYLIYGGEQRYYFDDIEILPMCEVLYLLPELLTPLKILL